MKTLAARPLLQDAATPAAGAAFAVIALVFDLTEGDSTATALSYVIVGVAAVALLRRRHSPVAVLAVVAASRILLTWDTSNGVALAPAAMVALYTVARSGNRYRNLAVAIAAALTMMVIVAALDHDPFLPEFLEEAQLLIPIAVGDAVRSRADRVRDLIDTEANSRVQAERLRIARDLHDVVAHGLSTIAIQSGVAAHLIDRDPDEAKDALEIINETGKSSLEELRVMVGVLRSSDEAPLRPTPVNPNELGGLLDGAANSGIDVTTTIDGMFPADVAESCVVAVHRIIQEALTNVARHAGAAATAISIQHGHDEVQLSIANEAGDHPLASVPSTGVGIIGMAERAEALGGTLTAQLRADGQFEVAATIPYHPRTPGNSTP